MSFISDNYLLDNDSYTLYKTGDILLCSSGSQTHWPISWLSNLIKLGTKSAFTHVAIVLKNPHFIHPSLHGFYVWESSYESFPDPQDNKLKLGVRITPLSDFIEAFRKEGGSILHRSVHCSKSHFSTKILEEVHQIVYNKPYDICPLDWIKAYFRGEGKKEDNTEPERFWCSAFVGYVYMKCGILKPSVNWSTLRPSDFALESTEKVLPFEENCSLSNFETRLL